MTFKKALATTLLTAALSLPITFIDTQPAFAASSDTKSSDASPKAKSAKTAKAKSGKKDFRQVGTASWYGPGFNGKKTASGKRFDQNKLTAAHRSLPLDTVVKVTNLDNGKAVKVEINDRGPYSGKRVIDLSRAAARKLDMTDDGTARVRIEVAELPGSSEQASAD
ncbi:MAG TPA: septal ring lytic transglycosylase RlpA family protein [Skermanella sp.]|jgi:rare lipoprotein A|nr:septal ring lytic transglycosylase RlpA family protein [Skermanella sp.]